MLGQVAGGLARGVARADDVDVLALHRLRFGDTAAVEGSCTDESLERGDPEGLIARPGGRPETQCPPPKGPGRVGARDEEPGATDAERKAEIVADERARAGLAAD